MNSIENANQLIPRDRSDYLRCTNEEVDMTVSGLPKATLPSALWRFKQWTHIQENSHVFMSDPVDLSQTDLN